jgi:DMATS type aromatic prenyltransferase
VFPGSDGVTENPIPRIAERVGADLRWFNQFADEFFPSEEDAAVLAEKMPKDTIRIPKVFLAFDLKEDKQTMKAYFYPVIKYMTSKKNSDRAGFDLIRRLEPLGASFGPALDIIEEYQKKLYQDPPLTVVIGIDCVSPEEGARVKIYIEPQSNTWEAVQEHVTLGGKRKDKTTLDGLSILHDMWNLLINELEDREIDDKFSKEILEKKPGTSGACFRSEGLCSIESVF